MRSACHEASRVRVPQLSVQSSSAGPDTRLGWCEFHGHASQRIGSGTRILATRLRADPVQFKGGTLGKDQGSSQTAVLVPPPCAGKPNGSGWVEAKTGRVTVILIDPIPCVSKFCYALRFLQFFLLNFVAHAKESYHAWVGQVYPWRQPDQGFIH